MIASIAHHREQRTSGMSMCSVTVAMGWLSGL
jgi:hypothetical protein